jgi:transposase
MGPKGKKDTTKEEDIYTLLKSNATWDYIQKILSVRRDRISRVAKAIKNGDVEAPPQIKMGAPVKLTDEIRNFVETETLRQPKLGSRSLASKIHNELRVEISQQSVTIIRHNQRFCYRAPRSAPLLTPVHIQKRIAFCNNALNGDIDWGTEVIISDESRFGLYNDNHFIWIRRGEYNPETFRAKPKYHQSVMVWGAIGYNYKSPLIFVDGNLNSEGYKKLLRDNSVFKGIQQARPKARSCFQQDGAACHTSKSSVSFLKENTTLIEDWPPNSPDLSPIENMWALVKEKITKREPKTMADLKKFMIEEWDLIDQSLINRMIVAMPKRFLLCLKEDGRCISHIMRQVNEYPDVDIDSKNDNLEMIQEQCLENNGGTEASDDHTVNRYSEDLAIAAEDGSLHMLTEEPKIIPISEKGITPNAYFYRNKPPGQDRRVGPWDDEEKQLFLKLLADRADNPPAKVGDWGLFSLDVPGRIGYQCATFFRHLVMLGELKNPKTINTRDTFSEQ